MMIEAALSALVFFSVFFFGSVDPWSFMALAAVLLLLSFGSLPELGGSPVPRKALIIFLLVFLWIIVQTAFFIPNRSDVFNNFILWAAFGMLPFLSQKTSRNGVIFMLWAVTAAGFCEAAYGLYQVMSGDNKVLWRIKDIHAGFATGTYLNRNHFAGLLEMSLGVQFGLLLRACSKKHIKTALLLSVITLTVLIALLKSGSRAGVISFSTAMLLVIPYLKRASNRSVLPWIGLICLIFGGAFLGGGDTLSHRLAEIHGKSSLLEGRTLVWKSALPLLSPDAWRGAGLGNFHLAFASLQPASLVYGWDHAHNDYLELAVELGVPAFLLLCAAFFILFRHISIEMLQKDFSTFALTLGCLTGIISIMIHGLTDFNFAIPANTFIFCLLFSFCLRLMQFDRQVTLIKKSHV